MPVERINRLICNHCGAVLEMPDLSPFLLQVYVKYGWTFFDSEWYCKDCRLDKVEIDYARHPQYIDFEDWWGHREPEDKKSCFFTDEPYDHYADRIQHDLCNCCRYMELGYEDYGSTWRMCMVDEIGNERNYGCRRGHNLYSGHFYGAAISGRICPYFTTHDDSWVGRNPVEDKKNGTFHVPYNELYDGD